MDTLTAAIELRSLLKSHDMSIQQLRKIGENLLTKTDKCVKWTMSVMLFDR